MQKLNCAIYVRKSNEKGLEMEFNSLQNQEEACKNYILSQTFNGWEHYKTYTDGGISGGTMKRPALLEMMDEVKKGNIQVVVSYKVDRLSRSIVDFHNMMKEFEKYNCSFVSITQAFDTSTSMGKLTLNMLLSFAQFEREVSSERIRDKISASKAKGMWMGGTPPLGYDVKNKKLVINKKEAEDVRFIFEKYLKLGSISSLREFVHDAGIKSKAWTAENGRKKGGRVFSSSMLARLLRSRVYIGKVENKRDKSLYEGQHKAIIEKDLFDRAQRLMDGNLNKHNETYSKNSFLLSGRIMDADGNMFKNQKSSKNGSKKYRYYALKGKYIPAGDLEEITVQVVRSLLDHPLHLIIDKSLAFEFKAVNFDELNSKEQADLIRFMIAKIIYHNHRLTYFINIGDVSYLKAFKKENYLNTADNIADDEIHVSNDGLHMIIEREIRTNSDYLSNKYVGCGKMVVSVSENNNNLIKALSVGWRYGRMSQNGMTVKEIAGSEHRSYRDIYRYMTLNYLSPSIVNDIMDGRTPGHVNLQTLFAIAGKYGDFDEQEKAFYRTAK